MYAGRVVVSSNKSSHKLELLFPSEIIRESLRLKTVFFQKRVPSTHDKLTEEPPMNIRR